MRSLPFPFLCTMAFAALISAATPAQSQTDDPSGKLGTWLGRWPYSGQIYKTPYSDAHSDSGTGVCNWAPGNGYIICDYFSNDPPHNDLLVLNYSPSAKTYSAVVIHQDRPPSYEKMTRSGNTWISSREFQRDGKPFLIRTVFTFPSSDKQTTTVQISPDHGRTWTTIIQTAATKSADAG